MNIAGVQATLNTATDKFGGVSAIDNISNDGIETIAPSLRRAADAGQSFTGIAESASELAASVAPKLGNTHELINHLYG